jgi:membrane-associated phospholipid phosphatase
MLSLITVSILRGNTSSSYNRHVTPTFVDLKIIQLFAPFQVKPLWVDATDILSQNALVNGFIYAAMVFLYWHFSGDKDQGRAERIMLTILIGTVIGALGSLALQQVIGWPPPAFYPPLKSVYALHSPLSPNSNSFPSDSAMLYSTVAFGMAAWSRKLSMALLGWLLIFIAPIRIFVGGHYPSDILAGVFLGFCSLQVARALVRTLPRIESLASSQATIFRLILFLWLFEIGNEFADFSKLLHTTLHLIWKIGKNG